MRSVVKALKGRLRTVHLVLYDYAFNPSTDLGLLPQSTTAQLEREYGNGEKNETGISQGVEQHLEETWRVVQTPSWLKFSAINASTRSREGDAEGPATTNNDPNFRYAGHSEIFQLPTSQYAGQTDEEEQNLGETEWKRKDWKAKALPTYNSMAIEGRIGWIPGLADVSVAMNDDFFMLQELSVRYETSRAHANPVGVRLPLASIWICHPLRFQCELWLLIAGDFIADLY